MLLEVSHVLIQDMRCTLSIGASDSAILVIAHLDNQLMKRLFLLAASNFFIVIRNASILSGLLGIETF